MNDAELIHFLSSMLVLVLYLSAPILVIGAGVGLVVGLFQAVTQVQDPSLAYCFKLIAVMVALALLGGVLARPLVHETSLIFQQIAVIR